MQPGEDTHLPELDAPAKEAILRRVRGELERERSLSLAADASVAEIGHPIIVLLFSVDGHLLTTARIDGDEVSLENKIRVAAAAILEQLEKSHTSQSPIEIIKASFIHVMVVTYEAEFANFGIRGLFDNMIYEPHVTGIVYQLNDRSAEINPAQSLIGNFGPQMARSELARQMGFAPKEMIRKDGLKIRIYRVAHFGESYPHREILSFHRGHRIFRHEDVSPQTVQQSLEWIGKWYANNVDANGEVTFEYYPSTAKYQNSRRTMVRSTMAVWILNRLARFLDDRELDPLGKRGLDYYLDRYYNIEESLRRGQLMPTRQPTPIGELPQNRFTTAGFLILSILERGELDRYAEHVRLLFDWVQQFQKPDGLIWTQYAQSQYFDTGQLLLAVASLYEVTQDVAYRKFVERSLDAYLVQLRQMLELGNGLYAPYAPAWFTQPLAKMFELTGEPRWRDMIYAINTRVVRWYEVNTADKAYWDYDGILVPKMWSYGNVSITAASLESLVDAAYIARLDGNEAMQQRFAQVIPQTVAYLCRLQYVPENTYYFPHRERVLGGFKTDLVNSKVWCDNVWHLAGAFMKIIGRDLLACERTC